MTSPDPRPLIAHVVYSFDVGGLENGVVNLINRLPESEFRHAVIALTRCAPSFCRRVVRADVEFHSLEKPPGHGWRVYRRALGLFKQLEPAIVHTRNLAALEMQLPAALASVPVRVHGEHGRDMSDPDGTSWKYKTVRRVFSPFVTHYVALSRELQQYLTAEVGIGAGRVASICNGVDERKFMPLAADERAAGARRDAGDAIVIGTVGRLEAVKDQLNLVAAVERLIGSRPELARAIRVQLVGDGPMRQRLRREVDRRGLGEVMDLVGERNDIAEVMRGFDIFVLPSRAEGISNTILEAMASGLPVVATAVGGNGELVSEGHTGQLVPAADPAALADALGLYIGSASLREAHGANARAAVEARFSLTGMVEAYRRLYLGALSARMPARAGALI